MLHRSLLSLALVGGCLWCLMAVHSQVKAEASKPQSVSHRSLDPGQDGTPAEQIDTPQIRIIARK